MKLLKVLLLIFLSYTLFSQEAPRIQLENELKSIKKDLEAQTNAKFEMGPLFIFNEPYKATFTQAKDYSYGIPPNRRTANFLEGESILVIGAQAIGKVRKFKKIDSEEIFETKAFGKPGFEIKDTERYKLQMQAIKKSDWQKAQEIASVLNCGALGSMGRSDIEKHHIQIGDTQVFFQIRQEDDKILLYLDLRVYGGTDFKNMGAAQANTSLLTLTLSDDTKLVLPCESDDERFAIFDLTDHVQKISMGINLFEIELSNKNLKKQLTGTNKYAIGLKVSCFLK